MTEELRMFLASPGDVPAERVVAGQVVSEINQTHGEPLGYRLRLLRWETDAAPGAGRPQQIITDQIGTYEVFVGIMWRRFGTPTGVAGSGTEEEFRLAYQRWERNPEMILMFYFCQKPFMPRTIAEVDQMRQVLLFRRELEGKALVWDYPSPDDFSGYLRQHLCLRMNRRMQDRERLRPRAQPDDAVVDTLRNLWKRMDPDLQRAFSVAYNENRRAGDAGVQTRDLFAALLRVQSERLSDIVEEIPRQALPEPTSGAVTDEPYIVQERPWLSHCVSSSIARLSKALPAGKTLSAADIFADIAKHGTGESVALLRRHNIGPAEIDAILRRKGVAVVNGVP